jgi:zinc protease
MLPIQHWITSTQTPVYFVKTPELPVLELRIIFDAGSARDGKYPGLSELTHNLLREGTAQLSAEQLADQFENIGAIFHAASDHDMAVVSLRTLTRKRFFIPALQTLTTLLNAPLFSKQGFAHQQKLLLSLLKHQEQSPRDLAENAFFAALYPHHPYKNPPIGIKKSILELTPEHTAEFYREYYCAQNARIVMVGNLILSRAKKIAEEISQKLPQGRRAVKLPVAANLTAAKTKKIIYPSTQTHILMVQVGIHRMDPDYFSLYVGNYILGGDPLASKLGQAVREKKGLAYDIRSYFLSLACKGPFLISFQTRSEKAQLALDIAQKTLNTFIAKKPQASELEAAKNNLAKGYNLRFDSNAAIAGNLVTLAFYDLPFDYFDTFIDRISSVTPLQVYTAFNTRIKPHNMAVIFLGE